MPIATTDIQGVTLSHDASVCETCPERGGRT